MKKVIALCTLLSFVSLVSGQGQAFAAFSSIQKKPIKAVGSLASTTSLVVSLLNDTGADGLSFVSNGTNLVITAPELVHIQFNDNTAGYQAIVVSTDNKNNSTTKYTGAGTGAGLVGVSDTTFAAPLHWTVFETVDLANAYPFTKFTSGTYAGQVDNRTQFYIVDRNQGNVEDPTSTATPKAKYPAFDSNAVIGFASVLYDINGTSASLANAPYDTDRDTDNDSNANTLSQNDGPARKVTNGNAYMKIAVDYNGQPAQNYITESLTLDLITIS